MSPAPVPVHPSRAFVRAPQAGPRRVVVKFRDGVSIPYEDGVEKALTGELAALWEHLASQGPLLATLRLDRLFTSTPAGRIRGLVALARHTDPAYVSPPDFLTFFVVDCPRLAIAADVATSLSRSDLVERAYVQSLPAPLPSSVNPDDRPWYPKQLYLQSAPGGVDAPSAWSRAGGAGQGVTFADVEAAWTLDHEDLLDASGAQRVGLELLSVNRDNAGQRSHGTAVLGVVTATDNEKGCLGVAPWPAKALAIGQWRKISAGTVDNIPDAILKAADLLGFGDVLLLELQHVPDGTSLQLPCELEPTVSTVSSGEGRTAYDVIRLATALGIAVIEPAGNGDSLRTYGVPFDGGAYPRFARQDPAFQDSGAIVVSASLSDVDPVTLGHKPCPGANHGSRVDCYAWGENVTTLGWSDEVSSDPTKAYTTGFDGTSSAAAIVAGVAVVVQGLAREILGAPLSAWQLRALLGDPELGTRSADPAVDGIGVMPDLKKILARLDEGIVDIYVRDFVGDIGLPNAGPLAMSPDIIVRNAPVQAPQTPQAAFGEGSGTEDDALLSQDVRFGQDQYVYVRVSNRGILASSPVRVEVYWAPPATLLTPGGWRPVGGPTTMPGVPGAGRLAVSPAIVWPAADVPAAGHYCFVALISSAEDPAPAPADFLDWDRYRAYVARNNNVTWRNFNVVQPLPDPAPRPPMGRAYEVTFRLVGPWDRKPRPMSVQVESDLPDGSVVELQAPGEVIGLLASPPDRPGRSAEWHVLRLPHPGESLLPAGGMVGPGLDAECRLRIQLPGGAEARPYRFAIRQLERDQELGRITWRLVPGSAV
jgi:serine protease